MVQLKYKGQNTLYVGGYALKAGYNEMKDEDFYRLMKSKTFKVRVETKVLEVPAGFPIEKPVKNKPAPTPVSSEKKAEEAEEKVEEEQAEHISVKATLKLIEKSDDADYLQSLIDKDTRPKVVEEAKKKLNALK